MNDLFSKSKEVTRIRKVCAAIIHENLTKCGNWAGYWKKKGEKGKMVKVACRAFKDDETFKLIISKYM